MLAPVWVCFPCLVPTMRSRVGVVMCCFAACIIPDREIHAEAPSWFLRAEKAGGCLRTKPPPRCAGLKGLPLVLRPCVCPCPSPWPSELCLSLCYRRICGRAPMSASRRAPADRSGRRGSELRALPVRLCQARRLRPLRALPLPLSVCGGQWDMYTCARWSVAARGSGQDCVPTRSSPQGEVKSPSLGEKESLVPGKQPSGKGPGGPDGH